MKKSKRKLRKVLERLMEREKYVSLDRRPLDAHPLEGFVAGVSEKRVMLHVVDGHTLTFNGYTAVRLKDLRAVSTPRSFIPRALKLLGRTPVRPERLDLTDWATLLASARESYPLVWLACEGRRPDCGYVGEVRKLTRSRVSLREVNPQGRWKELERFRLAEITLVTLGDGYLEALGEVLAHPEAPGRSQS